MSCRFARFPYICSRNNSQLFAISWKACLTLHSRNHINLFVWLRLLWINYRSKIVGLNFETLVDWGIRKAIKLNWIWVKLNLFKIIYIQKLRKRTGTIKCCLVAINKRNFAWAFPEVFHLESTEDCLHRNKVESSEHWYFRREPR